MPLGHDQREPYPHQQVEDMICMSRSIQGELIACGSSDHVCMHLRAPTVLHGSHVGCLYLAGYLHAAADLAGSTPSPRSHHVLPRELTSRQGIPAIPMHAALESPRCQVREQLPHLVHQALPQSSHHVIKPSAIKPSNHQAINSSGHQISPTDATGACMKTAQSNHHIINSSRHTFLSPTLPAHA